MIGDLAVLILVILFAFIPTFIARSRNLKKKVALTWCNVFLGWFIIPWIFLLAWSLLGEKDIK